MSLLPFIKHDLNRIGYSSELLAGNVALWNGKGKASLVAHSRLPKDIRTAAIAVIDEAASDALKVEEVRATGAALVFGLRDRQWTCSRVSAGSLRTIGSGVAEDLSSFFDQNQSSFNPDAIYRAKAWGRLDIEARQLDFVDNGLLPAMEEELGQAVSRLLEECVQDLVVNLGWETLEESSSGRKKAEWLVQAPFWLMAAKTLHDKNVEGFKRIDLQDFDGVFSRLGRHYKNDDSQPLHVAQNRRKALASVASKIERFASLELLSAEALGHVYESTLINKATRKLLGTHSTPPWLIDYILGKLRPWITEMPTEERAVFEPACGHAGFLVGALRLLDELRPQNFSEQRIPYLRKRLYGVDIDPFSQEVARLALTLADVPNPNGWKLDIEDVFLSDVVEKASGKANIVLANPPFEDFGSVRQTGWLQNKAAETLSRIVHNLPLGGVIGFVGPQSFLQSPQAKDLRRRILREYEISEVTLFADQVFQYGEPESTVFIARRIGSSSRSCAKPIQFRRVREGEVGEFSVTLKSGSVEEVTVESLCNGPNFPLFVPDLTEVWAYFKDSDQPILKNWAVVGKGLEHRTVADPSLPSGAIRESDAPFKGGYAGFGKWSEKQLTHELPKVKYLNLDPSVVKIPRRGVEQGIPQLLINYARVSRGPWRLKCLLDEVGHAVTSRFVVVRPTLKELPLAAVWAILNSPLANAYAYSWLTKRDNLVGRLQQMPVPIFDAEKIDDLASAAEAYLHAAREWSHAENLIVEKLGMPLFDDSKIENAALAGPPTSDMLKILHLRVDAAVMNLYNLPRRLERKILDLFDRESDPRKGVPFRQIGYFPKSFKQLDTAVEFLAVMDWEAFAERKTDLIEKKVMKKASEAEMQELQHLKRLSSARRDFFAPVPMDYAMEVYEQLKREAFRHK